MPTLLTQSIAEPPTFSKTAAVHIKEEYPVRAVLLLLIANFFHCPESQELGEMLSSLCISLLSFVHTWLLRVADSSQNRSCRSVGVCTCFYIYIYMAPCHQLCRKGTNCMLDRSSSQKSCDIQKKAWPVLHIPSVNRSLLSSKGHSCLQGVRCHRGVKVDVLTSCWHLFGQQDYVV